MRLLFSVLDAIQRDAIDPACLSELVERPAERYSKSFEFAAFIGSSRHVESIAGV